MVEVNKTPRRRRHKRKPKPAPSYDNPSSPQNKPLSSQSLQTPNYTGLRPTYPSHVPPNPSSLVVDKDTGASKASRRRPQHEPKPTSQTKSLPNQSNHASTSSTPNISQRYPNPVAKTETGVIKASHRHWPIREPNPVPQHGNRAFFQNQPHPTASQNVKTPQQAGPYSKPLFYLPPIPPKPHTPRGAPASEHEIQTLSNIVTNISIDDHPVQSVGVFVSHFLTNHLLYDNALLRVDSCTLVRLSRTCRTAHVAVQTHIALYFDINAHLSRYFDNPLAFRSLQAQTNTLISGSNALQFLDRTFYPESDLDLYCFRSAAEEIGLFLIAQGYTFSRTTRQRLSFLDEVEYRNSINGDDSDDEYNNWDPPIALKDVYSFVKPVNNSNEPNSTRKVQLVVAKYSPLHLILHFHSSEYHAPPL